MMECKWRVWGLGVPMVECKSRVWGLEVPMVECKWRVGGGGVGILSRLAHRQTLLFL